MSLKAEVIPNVKTSFFPPDIEIEFRFADILVADTMESACLRYNINNQS